MLILNADKIEFIQRNQLDESYLTLMHEKFADALELIIEHQNSASQPIVLGINGCQGSGKSTLSDYLATVFASDFNKQSVVLSLDDFYYSHAARQDLARNIHPMLATRGVPGTHDIGLALDTISSLRDGQLNVALPRFDKSTDDPFPVSDWPRVSKPVDIIILEGWCLGAPAQTNEQLIEPLNSLERDQDPQGIWRQYVNQQLAEVFPALHAQIDILMMLKAPSFNSVLKWRLEQEHKLAKRTHKSLHTRVMSDAQIEEFIQYFQRLTEHCLANLPSCSHLLFELDDNRNIVQASRPRGLLL